MADRLILVMAALIILRGMWKRQDVYAAFVQGGRRGLESAVALLPALCAMTLLMALLQGSGLMDMLLRLLTPVLTAAGIPPEAAPVLLLRPLSGSGSLAALQQIMDTCGVDSRAARCAAVLMSSSETILYTMTVYLGATDIRRLPWALPVSLVSYAAGAAVCGAMI